MTSSEVSAISNQLPGIDDQTVAAVMQALKASKEGAPVGTVLRDPSTGAVAHRVTSGVHLWHVSAPDGSSWTDTQPTLVGWVELVDKTAGAP